MARCQAGQEDDVYYLLLQGTYKLPSLALLPRARCTAGAPHHWPTLAEVAQTQSKFRILLQMAAL